jgi:hypothetical protein
MDSQPSEAKPMKDFPTRYPLVRIDWIDACEPADNSEVEEYDVPDLQMISQVGFLIRETESSLSVAGAWKPELNTFDYVITIPRIAVQKRTVLSSSSQ